MGTVTRIGRGPQVSVLAHDPQGRPVLPVRAGGPEPRNGRIDHPGCYEQSLTAREYPRDPCEAGFAPEQVAKMTVFLTDMGQKDAFDRAFERVFRRVPEEGMPRLP